MAVSGKIFNSLLKKYSKIIEPAMADLLCSHTDKKNKDIIKYQAFTGGKRLRPALALVSCQILGGKISDVLYPAAGLEILHNYSLIVDDIIDKGILRRNKPTTWAKFGKSVAECITVDYASSVFQAATRSKNPAKISELFAKTLKTIVDGELLDILFERSGRNDEFYISKNRYQNISEANYFEMAGRKTAALFEASCECGGIIAKADPKQLLALRNYGRNLGIAFQIQDDILDIFGKTESFGKKVGKDIAERKGGNIIILLALKKLPPQERQKILTIMKKDEVETSDIDTIMKLIIKTDSLQRAYLLEKKFLDKAKENLNQLPKNKWNDILEEAPNYLLVREK